MANTITAKIVDNRFIGKIQLNADDMGGVGCANWDNYLKVCDKLAISAWNHVMNREVDETALGFCVTALFDFFGITVTDPKIYHARILATMIERKAVSSQALKDAKKVKSDAKKAYEEAIENEETEEVIESKKSAYEEATETVNALYLEPNNYYYDPAPMFDKRTLKATAKARKALEDTCADIFAERQFMNADELKAEKIRLEDERKGREIRKKAEAKAKKNAK